MVLCRSLRPGFVSAMNFMKKVRMSYGAAIQEM